MSIKISTDKQKIIQYLDFKDISKNKFYKETSFSNGFLDSGSSFSVENLRIILDKYRDLNPEWLLTGKGEMIKKPTEKFPIETNTANVRNLIPAVDIEAIGGFGSGDFAIDQSNITNYYDIPLFKNKKVDFICPVRGNSMLPRYQPGDMVACTIVRENSFIQWNEIHVVATREQGILLKRVKKSKIEGHLTMISEDKEFEPFDVPKNEITGIALVVGSIRLE
jgi:phage repressor protein C with HTH and peptisase S24 domain